MTAWRMSFGAHAQSRCLAAICNFGQTKSHRCRRHAGRAGTDPRRRRLAWRSISGDRTHLKEPLLMERSRVAVLKTAPSSVIADYGRLMRLACYQRVLPRDREIALKINISWH